MQAGAAAAWGRAAQQQQQQKQQKQQKRPAAAAAESEDSEDSGLSEDDSDAPLPGEMDGDDASDAEVEGSEEELDDGGCVPLSVWPVLVPAWPGLAVLPASVLPSHA